jgi:hypothetical protein
MRILLVLSLALILAACSSATQAPGEPAGPAPSSEGASGESSLPDLGPAPELENEVWLNTDGPLTLAGLRGKVVLLDMWTFG